MRKQSNAAINAKLDAIIASLTEAAATSRRIAEAGAQL